MASIVEFLSVLGREVVIVRRLGGGACAVGMVVLNQPFDRREPCCHDLP